MTSPQKLVIENSIFLVVAEQIRAADRVQFWKK